MKAHLEGGIDNFHGRVILGIEREGEIVNGTICDQSIIFGDTQHNLAKVICNMLGYK